MTDWPVTHGPRGRAVACATGVALAPATEAVADGADVATSVAEGAALGVAGPSVGDGEALGSVEMLGTEDAPGVADIVHADIANARTGTISRNAGE